MKDVKDKILKITEEANKKKIEEQKKQALETVKKDREIIEKILGYVEKRLVYKILDRYSSPRYIVVTDEIFLEDYVKNPERSWNRSTKISSNKYGELIITVNGHNYYHLGHLITNYERDLSKAMELSQMEVERLGDRRRLLNHIKEQEPEIKRMLIEYQETVKENETSED